ncbi:MAG: adenylate/guanylate cyclase domain-containing protein [Lachnospiraceae bacterium]|nr:adenylate/guanylate cyclase domain-containing protein [Lachnospiraceae bacterium]
MAQKKGFKHKKVDIRIKLGVSILVGICVFLLVRPPRPFGTLDEQLSNFIYQSESVSTLPITIVKIDEETLNALGQPSEWSRQVYADLVEILDGSENPPAVIIFDTLFTGYKNTVDDLVAAIEDGKWNGNDKDIFDEISKGDIALAEAAAKYGNVVTGINAGSTEHGNGRETLSSLQDLFHNYMVMPYDELKENVALGITNCDPDELDYITKAYTGMWFEGKWYDSLSISGLRLFMDYVAGHPEYAEKHPEYADFELPDYSAMDNNWFRFSFSEAVGGFSSVPLIKILNGDYPAGNLGNEIVLVGAYATGLGDAYPVYLSNSDGEKNMNGVEIHANIMEAVFEGKLQTEAKPDVIAVVYAIISAGLIFTMLSVTILKGMIFSVSTLVLHIISSIIFYKNDIYIHTLYMVLVCITLSIAMIIFHYVNVRAERVKINNAFRMYVAPEIVDDVAESGSYQLQLGGRNKDVAVLFVDIRGFTTMSENLAPEEVVEILNEYFGVITDAIFKNKGTLDKFIGDAAMAVFNSPFDLDDYVFRAVSTACDIARASETLGEKLMERFGKKVSYGIGVNCGQATIGNIGSNFRMDYTAIGDTVNTAARLESNAKAGEILISEEVKNRLADRIETEDVGEIPLKGKHNKIFVYRVKSLKDQTPKGL